MNNTSNLIANSLDIPEILNKVLGYLNVKTLLACRLVNHSWNESTVEILNKKSCLTGLNSSNIQEFVALKQTNSDSSLVCLNLSLNIQFPVNLAVVRPEFEKEEEFINSTIKLLESSSLVVQVSRLTFTCPPPLSTRNNSNTKLLQLLTLVAPTLEHLKLTGNIDINTTNVGLQPQIIHHVPYPNLTSITCFGSILSCSEALCSLINNSAVQRLSLFPNNMFNNNEAVGITTILTNLNSAARTSLMKLELCINQRVTYNVLCALSLPHLECLALHLQIQDLGPAAGHGNFGTFVQLNCPNLKRLDLYPKSNDELLYHFIANFPSLPQITSFGFYLCKYPASVLRLNTLSDILGENYLRILSKFPSLTTIGMDYELLSCVGKYFTSLGGNSTSLSCDFMPRIFRETIAPLITKIKLNLSLRCYGRDIDLSSNSNNQQGLSNHANIAETYFNQRNSYRTSNYLLNKLFPSCKYLKLQPNYMSTREVDANYHDCMDSRMTQTLPRNLLRAIVALRGLRKLEINNYIEDWLNQILVVEEGGINNNVFETLSNLEVLSVNGCKLRNSTNGNKKNNEGVTFDLLNFLEQIYKIGRLQIDENLLQDPKSVVKKITGGDFPCTNIELN